MTLILSNYTRQAWVAEANVYIFLGEFTKYSRKVNKDNYSIIEEVEIECEFGRIKTKNFQFLEKDEELPFGGW